MLALFAAGCAPNEVPVTGTCDDISPENGASISLVIAPFFAWYGTPTGPTGAWSHWRTEGDGPLLVTNTPVGGPYDSRDPIVIRRQLEQAEGAGIDAFAVSYWGAADLTAETFQVLLDTTEAANSPIQLAVLFETAGLASGGADAIISELDEVLSRSAGHPAYLRIDGRPVVFLYNVGSLPLADWQRILSSPEVTAHQAFFVADGAAEDSVPLFEGLWSFGPLAEYERGELSLAYDVLAMRAREHGKRFATTAFPGFDDRVIRSPSTVIPRREGATYEDTWLLATRARPDWIFLTSWNEWHEGSELEPSEEHGESYLSLTRRCVDKVRP